MSVTVVQAPQELFCDRTMEAAADLSGHQYKAVKVTAAGTVNKSTSTTDFPVYCLQNAPESGENAVVRPFGPTRAVAGAAFSLNARLMPGDSEGRLITATDNTTVCAIAMEAATAINQIVVVEWIQCPIKGDNT